MVKVSAMPTNLRHTAMSRPSAPSGSKVSGSALLLSFRGPKSAVRGLHCIFLVILITLIDSLLLPAKPLPYPGYPSGIRLVCRNRPGLRRGQRVPLHFGPALDTVA